MKYISYHVSKHRKGWAVRKSGSIRASGIFPDKAAAIQWALDRGNVYVFDPKTGRIADRLMRQNTSAKVIAGASKKHSKALERLANR